MPISYAKRSIPNGGAMSYQPNGYVPGPSELELRQRAAMRVARRRAFMTSLAITGSLAVLDLYLYSQSHDKVWLLLAVVFIGIVAYRGWVAFGGSDHTDSRRIQQEMNRMRPAAPSAPAAPVLPPPPAPGFYPPAQPSQPSQPPSDAAPWNI